MNRALQINKQNNKQNQELLTFEFCIYVLRLFPFFLSLCLFFPSLSLSFLHFFFYCNFLQFHQSSVSFFGFLFMDPRTRKCRKQEEVQHIKPLHLSYIHLSDKIRSSISFYYVLYCKLKTVVPSEVWWILYSPNTEISANE